MTKLEDAIAEAEAAEATAREQLQGWRDKAAQYNADVERLTDQLGEVALADPDAVPGLQSEIFAAQSGAAAADAAVRAAKRALQAAKDRVPAAQAEVLRVEASELWEQARERQAATDRLVAELLQHEGVTYLPVMVGNIGQTIPLPTVTDGLVEQAKAKDAEAARLLAPVRGEAVQIRLGPIRAGGMQQVVVSGRFAEIEQGHTKHLTLLVDGEPLLMEDGRRVPVSASWTDPSFSTTVEVPFGSKVEVRGDVAGSSVAVPAA